MPWKPNVTISNKTVFNQWQTGLFNKHKVFVWIENQRTVHLSLLTDSLAPSSPPLCRATPRDDLKKRGCKVCVRKGWIPRYKKSRLNSGKRGWVFNPRKAWKYCHGILWNIFAKYWRPLAKSSLRFTSLESQSFGGAKRFFVPLSIHDQHKRVDTKINLQLHDHPQSPPPLSQLNHHHPIHILRL